MAAAGGDGTVHEVVNGLAEATPADETVQGLAVLQAGSGNDFADMVGAAREIDAAVHAIREGNTRHVDLGLVEAFNGRNTLRRYFDNNLGIGFEAQVTVESRKIKRLRGFLIYLWATLRALRALRAYDQPHFEINWTDGAGNEHNAAKEMLLVSIGNSRRVGGAFFLTPDAVMDDGLFDRCRTPWQPQRGSRICPCPKGPSRRNTLRPVMLLAENSIGHIDTSSRPRRNCQGQPPRPALHSRQTHPKNDKLSLFPAFHLRLRSKSPPPSTPGAGPHNRLHQGRP